jgi:hypothetical protein
VLVKKTLSYVQECVRIIKEGTNCSGLDCENESLNSEFIWNNLAVKGMSISIQNYKVISFSGLPFSLVFYNLLNF